MSYPSSSVEDFSRWDAPPDVTDPDSLNQPNDFETDLPDTQPSFSNPTHQLLHNLVGLMSRADLRSRNFTDEEINQFFAWYLNPS
jgi:hypothetical protein